MMFSNGTTMRTLAGRAAVLAIAVGGMSWVGLSLAEIPEPDHIFYGTVPPDAGGTLSVGIGDDPTPVARFAVGTLGDHYVLRIPMDSVGPKSTGTGRPGDPAVFYLNGVRAASGVVGETGAAQLVDLSDATDEPGIRISDATITEGNEGSSDGVFALRLTPAQTTEATVSYSISAGTATSGEDFVGATATGRERRRTRQTSPSGANGATVTFAPGTTEQSIVVQVMGDAMAEPDETFYVTLENATGAPIVRAQATGTIVDDDSGGLPAISIADAQVREDPEASRLEAEILVQLSEESVREVTALWVTHDEAAIGGQDYVADFGTVTFAPGERHETLYITILDDAIAERSESFLVKLESPSGATIAKSSSMVTILDDDSRRAGPELGRSTVSQGSQVIHLGQSFVDPVVILGPATGHGPSPGTVVLEEPSSGEIRIALRNRNGTAEPVEDEELSWIALERGRHVMDDGSIWEAGSFELEGTGPGTRVDFQEVYPQKPMVFLTTQRAADGSPTEPSIRLVDRGGFEAAAYEGQSVRGDDAASGQVGYLAVYNPRGSGTVLTPSGDVPYLMQEPSVGSRATPVLSWTLHVERPGKRTRGRDDHVQQDLAVLAIGPHLFAQRVTEKVHGPSTIRMRAPQHDGALEWGTAMSIDSDWKTVPLARRYYRPVVVAEPMLLVGMQSNTIQVRNVAGDSFEMRCDASAGCSGAHATYLVAEEGKYLLGGLAVDVGTTESSLRLEQGWDPVRFGSPFGEAPGVFVGVQTHNNESSLAARMHGLDAAGFDVSLQSPTEQPLTSETIGWIAIERGSTATSDGRPVGVYSNALDRTARNVRGVRRSATSGNEETAETLDGRCVTVGAVGSTFNPVESFVIYETVTQGMLKAFISSGDAQSDEIVEDAHFFQAE